MEKLNIEILNNNLIRSDYITFPNHWGPNFVYYNPYGLKMKLLLSTLHEKRFQSQYLWELPNYHPDIWKL